MARWLAGWLAHTTHAQTGSANNASHKSTEGRTWLNELNARRQITRDRFADAVRTVHTLYGTVRTRLI